MINCRKFFPAALLAFVLALGACGGKTPDAGQGASTYTGPACMDVLTLPQDLTAYVPAVGGHTPLIAMDEQIAAADRQKNALFKPWTITKVNRWVRMALDKDFNMKPDRAFTEGGRAFSLSDWQEIVANSNKNACGLDAGPGITLRHTNLRAVPSSLRFYRDPRLPGEGYPFDYFQHSSLNPGTPLFICNTSRDGLWLLVESSVSAGWVPSGDVAGVDEAFMNVWQSRPLAALLKDRVAIGEITGHLGTLLPLSGRPASGGGASAVLYPRRGHSGKAEAATAALAPGAAAVVPLTLSPANVAGVGNGIMGQTYGWGGIDEKRDCSALTRDLMAPFGFFLPRNSSRQARLGQAVELAGLSNAEKETVIAQRAVPFRSFIWMPGHIALYLGRDNDKMLIFHNMWGLRTRDAAGGCDGRAIVGKAVVTTLKPGMERPDLCNPGSFLDRIERIVMLP